MVLILIIENQYHVRSIITQDNYVAIEFDNYKIQDKGFTKLEAFYIVCFKTLQEFWVEGKTSATYEYTEPFDEYDLK